MKVLFIINRIEIGFTPVNWVEQGTRLFPMLRWFKAKLSFQEFGAKSNGKLSLLLPFVVFYITMQ
jgi:hypothetical protein